MNSTNDHLQLVPVAAKLVTDAIATARGLYVRDIDAVLQVAAHGETHPLHTFENPSPFGFHGLAQLGDSLYTFDQPLDGEPVLTEVTLTGEVVRYEALALDHPVGLAGVGDVLIVLNEPLPTTDILVLNHGKLTPVAQAHNMTSWLVHDGTFLWSDDDGIHQWDGHTTERRVQASGIQCFTGHLAYIEQRLTDGKVALDFVANGTRQALNPPEVPVALHPLPTATLARFGHYLSRAGDRDPWAFSSETEPGPLLGAGDHLYHLRSGTVLDWSTDGKEWHSTGLPVRCTRLVAAGPHAVIASGRKGSVVITPLGAPSDER